MDNSTLLQTLGLTDKEVLIYNLLLELGEAQASALIAKTELKRATVYKALYSLVEKGLVKQEDKAKKLHFAPLPPENLLKLSDDQFAKQERARNDLRSILPALTSNYILSVEKPVISTFEGVEGLKKIYEDTLKEGKEISAVLQTSDVNQELFDWLERKYFSQRIKRQIHANVIVASGTWSEEYIKERNGDFTTTLRVDCKQYPFAHEVDIYGDKIAFINYKKEEKLIGIVIHHHAITQTMRALFDLAWRQTHVQNNHQQF